MDEDPTIDDVSEKEILIEIFKEVRKLRQLFYGLLWFALGVVVLNLVVAALTLASR